MLTTEMNAQRKNLKLEWTEIMQKKFDQLKEEFKRKPIRAYPNYQSDEPFIVATDFSSENFGAILSHRQNGV